MKKRVARTFNLSMLTVGALLLGGLPLFAQDSPKSTVNHPVPGSFGVSAPVRQLAKLPVHHGVPGDYPLLKGPRRAAGSGLDTVEQPPADIPSNFTIGGTAIGIGWGFPNFNAAAAKRSFPDANIAVGDTQIVQVADSAGAVFDKSTGIALTPAMPIRTLWTSAGVGGPCSKSSSFFGNAIVQWDKAADRWLIAINVLDNYSGPYYACIAISTSDDALGTYYLYEYLFTNGGYPDQQRWGVWTDSYFQSVDNFGPHPPVSAYVGAEPCAYDRAKMLVGDPTAEQVCLGAQLSSSDFALFPGDIDSPTLPPAGQDEFLFSLWDTSHLALYSFHIDWSDPADASITGSGGSQLISVPYFNGACNGQFLGYCVPQGNSSIKLEVLGDRLRYRLVYYNDSAPVSPSSGSPSPSQHWLAVNDVQANEGQQAERWYEFTAPQAVSTVADISLYQSGTYAPDSNSRWAGSIARDSIGDILMGYSESSSKLIPSIAITGRTVSDPLGQMEDEQFVFFGSAPQKDRGGRWGEYTSMRLDPDGCTLWYSSEYFLIPVPLDWDTLFSIATFAGCPPPPE